MVIGYRVELQAERMPGWTYATAFTDSYKHMECLGGMRLQFPLTLFTHAMQGAPANSIIKCMMCLPTIIAVNIKCMVC